MITPLAMDPAHPFPFISNLALNLLVTLRYPGRRRDLHGARQGAGQQGCLQAPDPDRRTNTFVTLDDLIVNNLDMLFPGMEIESCELFRVTRNAIVEPEAEAANDLLEMIETELRERHFAPIVRLEVQAGMDPVHRGMLAAELGLNEAEDVYEVAGMMAKRDLFELAGLDFPDLHDKPHRPGDHPLLGNDRRNIFHIIRENGPLLLQHPYESFATTVERFLSTAAKDPKVLAIKMTLYRTSGGAILDSLIKAAQNGKQVAVMVELKARFDEAANIGWARRLEAEGIHVTYGVWAQDPQQAHLRRAPRLRPAAPLLPHRHRQLPRRHRQALHRPRHARLRRGHRRRPDRAVQLSHRLLAAAELPQDPGRALHPQARHPGQDRARDQHPSRTGRRPDPDEDERAGGPGHRPRLYKASRAGVKVDLIVRDTCRFRPGIPGLSENARVVSIVGRFLEHARILYFSNGGDEEYYIGSADMMRRNLESRVEVHAPVENPELRQELR
jgi:polyphosphate kinase